MNAKKISSTLFGLALALCISASLQAGTNKNQSTDEMQAMMEKVKLAGTPGNGHEVLKSLAGNWKVTASNWMEPGTEPVKSVGTSSMQWILGGRFLQQKFTGNWDKQKFEGVGLIGYDNIKGEYTSLWMDNMSTGMHQSTGEYDAETKTLKEKGTFSCPITEKDMDFRSEWKIIDKNKHVYTMYSKGPNNKKVYKTMELVYERIK